MHSHLKQIIALVVTFTIYPCFAEHIIWKKEPIHITLPVNSERLVSFPDIVQLGYDPSKIPASSLRVQNDNKTLYLLAKQAFPVQRVQAKLSNGKIILLDIEAKAMAPTTPISIMLPKIGKHQSTSPVPKLNYVTLMRYAIHQLYAPSRLLTHSNHITRFPMMSKHAVPLIYDNSAIALPLASWRGDTHYITAILMKNQLPQQNLTLKPQLLCGNWLAASFYPHQTLVPPDNTTTLFLISSRPFSEAIRDCIHP